MLYIIIICSPLFKNNLLFEGFRYGIHYIPELFRHYYYNYYIPKLFRYINNYVLRLVLYIAAFFFSCVGNSMNHKCTDTQTDIVWSLTLVFKLY